jgi:hypothetical protein
MLASQKQASQVEDLLCVDQVYQKDNEIDSLPWQRGLVLVIADHFHLLV